MPSFAASVTARSFAAPTSVGRKSFDPHHPHPAPSGGGSGLPACFGAPAKGGNPWVRERHSLEPAGLFDACFALLVDLTARQWRHALPPLDPVLKRLLAGRSTVLFRPVGMAAPAEQFEFHVQFTVR